MWREVPPGNKSLSMPSRKSTSGERRVRLPKLSKQIMKMKIRVEQSFCICFAEKVSAFNVDSLLAMNIIISVCIFQEVIKYHLALTASLDR